MNKEISMREAIEQAIFECIEDRVDSIKDANNYKEYHDANNRYSNLYKEIKELLPEHGRKLLFELESAFYSSASICERAVYKRGLIDGIGLSRDIPCVEILTKYHPLGFSSVDNARAVNLG